MDMNSWDQAIDALSLRKMPAVHYRHEADWTTEPVRRKWRTELFLELPGIEPWFLGRSSNTLAHILPLMERLFYNECQGTMF
jgi:hypothetical protein